MTMSNNTRTSKTAPAPIAIVGMACRFAGGATTPSKLWDICAQSKDVWSPIPAERFDVKSLYHPDKEKPGRNHSAGGYFLQEDPAVFDASFFNLSGDVSRAMDPQFRLLLESVYEATESAGIPLDELAGSNTSVYTGNLGKDYHDTLSRDPEVLPPSFVTGNLTAMGANRLSHFYDLRGPSMPIDTACSSGLVSLHLAVQSIRSGESDASIVGAASVLLNPDMFVSLSTVGFLGAGGRCYAWDARAEGYGRGEGVATLILKSLDDALRDGHHVYGVIKETGLNQDGKTATITSPSTQAQIDLIKACYRRAGLDMSETAYVEAHQTGTQGGDVVEAEALAKTFGNARSASSFSSDSVFVGSVKTNIGHTEPVSGLAAVIKTAFALKHGIIPPNLNYEIPSPKIPLDKWRLRVPTTVTKWPRDKPRRASVNNFGFGGSNAHVIMEAWTEQHSSLSSCSGSMVSHKSNNNHSNSNNVLVYLLSAKDLLAGQTMAKEFATYLDNSIKIGQQLCPGDLAYTLAVRRSRFRWVIAVRAKSLAELSEKLQSQSLKLLHAAEKKPRLGFVFNGQGAQWHAMGRELIHAYPVFRDAINNANKVLKGYGATWSILDELERDKATTRVSDIDLAQPISVAIQLCLVDLLRSWDIVPTSVTSHSSGEIAAAYCIGAISFNAALGIAYYRGWLGLKFHKLSSSLAGGMLAVGISPQEAEEKYLTDGRVVVACINSQSSVTLSGDLSAIDDVAARLTRAGVFARKLQVPLAYHSHHMLPMAGEYMQILKGIIDSKENDRSSGEFPQPFATSPVTGKFITSHSELTPAHWARNMTNPVLFSQAFDNMCFGSPESPNSSSSIAPSASLTSNVDMIVEIGAHGTLSSPIRQILKARNTSLPYISCLSRDVDAVESIQTAACNLLEKGYPVSLPAVNSPWYSEEKHKPRFVHDLPTYPWNHTSRYWLDSRISRDNRNKRFPPHELLGIPMSGANGLVPTWRNLRLSDVIWLGDHRVDGRVILPGAAYIAMAIEAVRLVVDASEDTIYAYQLKNVDILNALSIPYLESSSSSLQGVVETQFSLRTCKGNELESQGWYEFSLCSLGAGQDSWAENCRGYILAERQVGSVAKTESPQPTILNGANSRLNEKIFFDADEEIRDLDINTLFTGLREMGINHGPMFQNLEGIHVARNKSVVGIKIADIADPSHFSEVSTAGSEYVLHPTTLDSIFQAAYSTLSPETRKDSMFLPRSINSISISRELGRKSGNRLQVFTELMSSVKTGITSNISVVGRENKDPLFQMDGFFAQAIPGGASQNHNIGKSSTLCSKISWELDVLHNVPTSHKESMKIHLSEQQTDYEKRLQRVSYNLIVDAVAELQAQKNKESQNDTDLNWQWHHKIFFKWMQSVVARGASGVLARRSNTWAKTSKGMKQMMADELQADGAAGKMTVRVGRSLGRIVRGEVTPLELMMEDNLLNEYYEQLPRLKDRTYKHLAKITELFAVKNPMSDILEIGAGTGGATKVILDAFGARGDSPNSLIGSYTYTDISSGFFQAAKNKFSSYLDTMEFKKLDIESEQLDKSFEGGYDLVVASMVLHATKSLSRTLANVRKLLRPGGKLLMIEPTRDCLDTQLIFGTLPGWWLSEEPYRKTSPMASVDTWDKLLRETGFSGIDLEMGDCEQSDFQSMNVILTSAVVANVSTTIPSLSFPSAISIIYNEHPPPSPWLDQLKKSIQARVPMMQHITVESLDQIQDAKDKFCIFTADMETAFLGDVNKDSFQKLRHFLISSRGVLWLSCGSIVDATGNPQFAQTQGLLRTLRREDSSKRYVQLDFDTQLLLQPWTEDKINHIVHVLLEVFDFGKAHDEWEYAVKDSCLYVPRVFPDTARDAVLAASRARSDEENQSATLYDKYATYLVSGGLGGVGSAIAVWMMERGAKNVLLISRKAESHLNRAELLSKANEYGSNLQIRNCDISIETQLIKLLDGISKTLPPIRGVVNAAMVLDDTVLERMTFSQWQRVVNVRVAGSMNLHRQLPNLSFFIMLSSLTGILGHASQANYTAGNTFQDALARHRTNLGQPAVAFDLGVVLSTGYVADIDAEADIQTGSTLQTRMHSVGADALEIDDLLRIVEDAVRNPLRATPDDSQVLVGLSNNLNAQDRRFGTWRSLARTPDKTIPYTVTTSEPSDPVAKLVLAVSRGQVNGNGNGVKEAEDGNANRQVLAIPTAVVVEAIVAKVANMFNISAGEIDIAMPPGRYGVDSLVAVDLRNWLSRLVRVNISILEILQATSLADFGELVAARIKL